MANYTYLGNWDSTKKYTTNKVVKDAATNRYYRAISDVAIATPLTDSAFWFKLPTYVIEQSISMDYTFEELINNFDNPYDIVDNGLGLYRTHKKSSLIYDIDNDEKHFHKLGVKMAYEFAQEYYNSNRANMPEITGMYIVQGERKKNVITQGVSTAAVEAVGFAKTVTGVKQIGGINYASDGIAFDVAQTTNLGTSSSYVSFPWFDGSNFRLFPLINISRGVTSNHGYIWRIEEDAVTQLYVMNRGTSATELYEWGGEDTSTSDKAFNGARASGSDLFTNNRNFLQDYQENVKTNSFCLFTPDIMLDRSIKISSNMYVRPVRRFVSARDTSFTAGRDYAVFTQMGHNSSYGIATDAAGPFSYKDTLPRILDPAEQDYKTVTPGQFQPVQAEVVQENQLVTATGFSSRMKSILEVYGDDMQTGGDAPVSTTLTKYFSNSRVSNFNAGIVVNRQYMKTDNYDNHSLSTGPHAGRNRGNEYNNDKKYLMFGSIKRNPYASVGSAGVPEGERSLPALVTNLSMRTPPYVGLRFQVANTYLKDSSFTGTYSDYHNAIVNLCLYDTDIEYINNVLSSFNNLNEQYSMIDYSVMGEPYSHDIYRGDIISQKTFMRVVRWNDIPKSMSTTTHNWEYGWKQGKAINIYLQSVVNTLLRVPGKDETFYPYILSEASGTKQEIQDDFIWKSQSKRMYNESWKSNAGYQQLLGTMRLSSFEDIMLNKVNESKNRIRYSNKHISGAFTDAYKELPSDQYRDFGFEYGEIQKLVVINSILFSVQTSAINQHYASTKLQSLGDSSEIILGNKNVLASEYKNLAEFGTTHPESVINGDSGTFGVDWSNDVIWRIKGSETKAGAVLYGVENLINSKFVFDLFKYIKSFYSSPDLPQDLYNDNPTGIISTFDGENECVYITFQLETISKTLIFSERSDCFSGMISHDVNFYMQLNNRVFSYQKGSNDLWEHNRGELQKFHGINQPFELEFIVNGKAEKDASTFNKEFQAHLINMSPSILESIEWTTEYQYSSKDPFINEEEFWTNPDYRENVWRVPIIPNARGLEGEEVEVGPLGDTPFDTFESDSKMRGQWLKVKITYKEKEDNVAKYIYLRSVITNFIISFT